MEDDRRLRGMTAEYLALYGIDVVGPERCDAAATWLRTVAAALDALVTDGAAMLSMARDLSMEVVA